VTEAAVHAAEVTVRRNRLTNLTIIAIVGVTCLALVVIFAVAAIKVDAKASHTEATGKATYQKTVAIYNRQTTNLNNSNAIARCQLKGYNGIFVIVQNVLVNDKNPADYPRHLTCAIPAMPHKRTRK
jgi:hypothetical protein